MNILFQSLSPLLRLSLSSSSRYPGGVTPFTHYRSSVSFTRSLYHNTRDCSVPSATPSSPSSPFAARVEGGAQSKRANLNTVDRAQKQWEHRRTTRDASKWSNNRGTCVPARAARFFRGRELPGETAIRNRYKLSSRVDPYCHQLNRNGPGIHSRMIQEL